MGPNHSDPERNETGGQATAADLDDDQLYRGLAATDRRRLLYSLLTQGPATVDELATLLVGWHTTDTGRMANSRDRDRLVTELVHVHLPLLADAELVNYDDPSTPVEIGALDPAVEQLIRESISTEPPSRS